ncbi:hypothetical protein [Methylobacillus flagellatus]|uniref:hypothetical protein n=1 Tax=Methylobacillus flagellatus TaxID=405 RepID=UPI0010F7241F|nr:hypothetical protein [Methylobacillus flagellatus]
MVSIALGVLQALCQLEFIELNQLFILIFEFLALTILSLIGDSIREVMFKLLILVEKYCRYAATPGWKAGQASLRQLVLLE